MSMFWEQMKRGAKRASFEAERVIRIERVQSQISALNGQLRNGMTQLGYLAYDAMQRGEITHAELLAFRAQIDGLRAQIATHEAEIEAMRTEGFVEGAGAVYCAGCGTECPASMQFCARCGTPVPRPAAPPPAVPQPVGAQTPITPHHNASRLQPTVLAADTGGDACPRCAATNPLGAPFCAQCGHALTAPPATLMSQSSPRRMLDAGITAASRRQVYG